MFNTIIVGILKNFNSICNYTLDDLDGNYDYQEKKYILNKYKELKEKDKMINDFYVSKLRKDTIKKRVRRA